MSLARVERAQSSIVSGSASTAVLQ
jgi:hypothetical protein